MTEPSILIAADESAGGRHAVRIARSLAAQAGGRLTVVKVQAVRGHGNGMPAGRFVSSRNAEPPGADLAHFQTWLGADAGNGLIEPPEVVVAFGVPGIEITRLAAQRSADLIVLGRRPRSREHRLLLGETADALVRRSDIPVLFVPPEIPGLSRVLVALDGGDRSERVLQGAMAFATLARARTVEGVTVEPERDDEAGSGPAPLTGRSLRVERMLNDYAARHPEVPGVPLSVRRGNPIEELLAEVDAAGPDVLVIGYRRGGPPKVVGPKDIARNLLYASPSAVLTIPL